jgi:hypothetical protein
MIWPGQFATIYNNLKGNPDLIYHTQARLCSPLPTADVSSSEFTFKLFTRIIHDWAGESLVSIARGETGGRSVVWAVFLDRGAQDFVPSGNR